MLDTGSRGDPGDLAQQIIAVTGGDAAVVPGLSPDGELPARPYGMEALAAPRLAAALDDLPAISRASVREQDYSPFSEDALSMISRAYGDFIPLDQGAPPPQARAEECARAEAGDHRPRGRLTAHTDDIFANHVPHTPAAVPTPPARHRFTHRLLGRRGIQREYGRHRWIGRNGRVHRARLLGWHGEFEYLRGWDDRGRYLLGHHRGGIERGYR